MPPQRDIQNAYQTDICAFQRSRHSQIERTPLRADLNGLSGQETSLTEAVHNQDLVDDIYHLTVDAPRRDQLRIDLEVVLAGGKGGRQQQPLSFFG